jgi:hypothetical protein
LEVANAVSACVQHPLWREVHVWMPLSFRGRLQSLSSPHAPSLHHCVTNVIFAMLPVGAFDFEHSPNDKPKPSKLAPNLSLMPWDSVSQEQKCPHQRPGPLNSCRLDWSESDTYFLQCQVHTWCHLLCVVPEAFPPGMGQRALTWGTRPQSSSQLCL